MLLLLSLISLFAADTTIAAELLYCGTSVISVCIGFQITLSYCHVSRPHKHTHVNVSVKLSVAHMFFVLSS
jgi:hypothetical protein